jgi:hypothetical protein
MSDLCPACGHALYMHSSNVGSLVPGPQDAICQSCGCRSQREHLCADSRCSGCSLRPAVESGHYPKKQCAAEKCTRLAKFAVLMVPDSYTRGTPFDWEAVCGVHAIVERRRNSIVIPLGK